MDLGLAGKVVVVTGGSKGIGSAIVREFLKENAIVATFGRNAEAVKAFGSTTRGRTVSDASSIIRKMITITS